jgi:hypothetical protein
VSAVHKVLEDEIIVPVMRSCKTVSAQRPRDEFIGCLKRKLKWQMIRVIDEI